jgi:cysteine desulfurase
MNATKDVIYLDNHATTRIDPRVLEAMMPALTDAYGNAASRTHKLGWDAEAMVDRARAQVARLLGAKPAEIVFTSGATEAINLALKGLAGARSGGGRDHAVTLTTEHKATLDTCKHLERGGLRVTYLPVEPSGLVSLARLEEVIDERTLFVSVMLAHNEIGVIQPIAAIAELCRAKGALLHTDAAQAVAKIPIDVELQKIDLLSLSGHKLYAPKGVGALYVRSARPKVDIAEQQHGGGHEGGRRSGTLNVPGIAGLGAAAEIAMRELAAEGPRIGALRDRLQRQIAAGCEDTFINGDLERRLPGNLNIGFRDLEGESLLVALPRLAVSSGSACTSGSVAASHVLKALGRSDDEAVSSIRFGVGRFTTEEEIDAAAEIVVDTVRKLRAMWGAPRRR